MAVYKKKTRLKEKNTTVLEQSEIEQATTGIHKIALLLVRVAVCKSGGCAEVPVWFGARTHGARRAAPARAGADLFGQRCRGHRTLALSPFAAANGTTCAANLYAQNKHQQREET